VSGFLLSMIHRHQGQLDTVRPRMRSIFEPESAVAAANVAANIGDKQSGDSGYEKQPTLSQSPAIEHSIQEKPLSSFRPSRLQQPAAQSDQEQGNIKPPVLDRDRRAYMNKHRAHLQSELTQTFNEPEQSIAPGLSKQSTHKTALNVMALTGQIEEILKRYKNQTSHPVEGSRDSQNHAPFADAVNVVAKSLAALPEQTKTKAEQSAEADRKSANEETQALDAPINSPEGAFQVPAWLSGLQAELNSRLLDINAQSHAEPVINVTIGRIEVRAINPESTTSLETRKKPSGVLSLDDYLKQLEHKRRT